MAPRPGNGALRWALAEARQRNEPIQAVIAWRWDALEGNPAAPDRCGAVSERWDVTIVKQVREGRPGEALTAAARDANLLVIGSHGHSHRLQEVLGSTAEECVRNANCPVVALPPTQPR